MDSTSAPAWEQQRPAPVRARSAEDGGGAGGPCTVKRKIWMGENIEMEGFSFPPHAGPGDAPKGTALSLGGGTDPFFLCHIVLPQR